jgi:hypothetical protein
MGAAWAWHGMYELALRMRAFSSQEHEKKMRKTNFPSFCLFLRMEQPDSHKTDFHQI